MTGLVGHQPGACFICSFEYCNGDQFIREPSFGQVLVHKDVSVCIAPPDRTLLTRAYGTFDKPVMGIHEFFAAVAANRPFVQAKKTNDDSVPVEQNQCAVTRLVGTPLDTIAKS